MSRKSLFSNLNWKTLLAIFPYIFKGQKLLVFNSSVCNVFSDKMETDKLDIRFI